MKVYWLNVAGAFVLAFSFVSDVDFPEAADFYESLGNTKMTGEMHNAVGNIYMDYMYIPESVAQ